MPRPLVPGELHTYAEWLDLGYQVQAGQRHVARRVPRVGSIYEIAQGYNSGGDGVPLFSAEQVRPRQSFSAPPQRSAYRQQPGANARRDRRAHGQTQANPAPPITAQTEIRRWGFDSGRWYSGTATSQYFTGTRLDDVQPFNDPALVEALNRLRGINPPSSPSPELQAAHREVWAAQQSVVTLERQYAEVQKRFRKLVPLDEPRPFAALRAAERRYKEKM